MTFPRKTFITVSLMIAGLCLLLKFAQPGAWVGVSDLEIECIVTDAETGQPIPGAVVDVEQAKGGFLSCDCKEEKFSLTMDANGSVKRMYERCTTTGTERFFMSSFHIRPPEWNYRAIAQGYTPSEWNELARDNGILPHVKRGPPFARLLVPIKLTKSAVEPAAVPSTTHETGTGEGEK